MNFDTTTSNHDESCGTVQVTADPGTLLRALSKTFTSTTTVLAELLQNGRRAGATRIDIHVADEIIVVQDDGCGIADFNILLSIAQSGWDEAVKRNDAPYGLGFLSSLFSCKYLGVMSKGMHLYAATDDLIDVKKVPFNKTGVETKTEIRLHEHRLGNTASVIAAIERYARGFPIPVFVNEQEVDRPDAIENLELIDTPIGLVTRGVTQGYAPSRVYLQGLPISVGARNVYSRSNSYDRNGLYDVLHLASPRFEGRMPDRTQLIDAEKAQQEITEVLRGLTRDYVTERAAKLDPADFVDQYFGLAGCLNMHDLMNSFDIIPAGWLAAFCDAPTLTPSDWDKNYLSVPMADNGLPLRVVSRERMVEMGVFNLDDFDEYGGDFLAAHATHGIGAFVDDKIPSWHWAKELSKDVSPADFELIAGKEIGRHAFSVWGETANVVLVETLQARTIEALRKEIETVDIPLYYDTGADLLYMTPDASAHDAVRNVCDFVSDDDHDEEAESNAANDLYVIVQSLQQTDPLELFSSIIRNYVNTTVPDTLKGKSFKVSFDDQGRMSFDNP